MAIKTLLVDDERSLLDQAEIFLERIDEDLDIHTASSAKKALEKLDDEDFGAVVSDYQMPEIDGLEFLKQIREERESDIPFIMFTGKGREEVAMKALNLGADRYLQKGGDPRTQYGVLAEAVFQEVAHQRSEEKYRTVVENSNDAIYIYKEDELLFANEKTTEVTGYTREELTNMNVWSLIHPDDRKRIKKIEEARQKGENAPSKYQTRIITKDGEVRHFQLAVSPINYEGRKALLGSARDITEIKRKESKLEESKSWLDQVIEGTSVALFVIDDEHRVTHWNKSLEKLTGIDKEEVIETKDPWTAFYDEERPVLADLVLDDASEEEIEKFYGDKFSRSAVLSDAYEAEDYFPEMGEDGRWVYFTASPIKDSEGRKIGAIETLQNTTERKKVEEEVKEKHRRLKTLMDNVPGMSYRCENNRDWTMKFLSEACFKLTGYQPKELIDDEVVSYGELIHPDDRDKIWNEIQEAVDKGEPFEVEYRIETSSGEVKWVWERGRAVDFEDGNEHLEGLITDITKRKKAEDELTERMLAIEASIDGIAVLDEDGVYTYLNEKHAKIYGYESPDQLVGKSWRTLYDEEEQERFENEIMPQIGEDGGWMGEAVGMKKDGTKFPQELSLTALEDGGLVCVVRDVTERVKRERELEKKRKKFQEIFNNANDAIYLHELTEEGMPGKFIEVNQTATEMLGYSREEFLEMSPIAIDSGDLSDDLQDVMEKLTDEGGTKFEMVHQAKDGTKIPVEIQSHIFEMEGEKRVLSIARDITDRKDAKKRIEENKRKVERLHEISAELQTYDSEKDVYSFAVEAAENILDFDICSIDAVEGDKFVVKETSSNTPEDGSTERQIDEGSLGSKTYLNQESYLVNNLSSNKDAKPEKSEYSSAISIPVGEQGVFQAVSTDVGHFDEEDRKTAELLVSHVSEALERIQIKEREEFLHSLLRHDVGNKNQIIQGYLELMKDHDLPDELKEFVDKAERAAKDSKEIIQKVRMLRSIGEEEEISEVNLDSEIDKVISEHQDQLREKGIEISIGELSCKVKGGVLLEEMFSNLVENSIQHADCEKISISSQVKDGACVITLEDDGIGLSDGAKGKVFEKGFKQGENAGTGLGLHMVKEIAESYGGSVEVKDSEMGGARFDIHLKKPENRSVRN